MAKKKSRKQKKEQPSYSIELKGIVLILIMIIGCCPFGVTADIIKGFATKRSVASMHTRSRTIACSSTSRARRGILCLILSDKTFRKFKIIHDLQRLLPPSLSDTFWPPKLTPVLSKCPELSLRSMFRNIRFFCWNYTSILSGIYFLRSASVHVVTHRFLEITERGFAIRNKKLLRSQQTVKPAVERAFSDKLFRHNAIQYNTQLSTMRNSYLVITTKKR